MNWALRACQSLPPIPVLHGALPAVLLVGEQDVVEVVDSRAVMNGAVARSLAAAPSPSRRRSI
jgi:hypothetical protein